MVLYNISAMEWRSHESIQSSNTGLALIPKLKYEHLYLTSYSKMHIDLAALVRIILIVLEIVVAVLQSLKTYYKLVQFLNAPDALLLKFTCLTCKYKCSNSNIALQLAATLL